MSIRYSFFRSILFPILSVDMMWFESAFLGIKNRRPFDEALLMTIATVGAFFAGEFAEAVAVMVFYQVGELFQSYAVGRSRASIKELMDIVPGICECRTGRRQHRNG